MRVDRVMMLLLGGVAMVIYGMTLVKGVFPGESAQWMAIVSGFDPLEAPAYPAFTAITSWLSSLTIFTLPMRLNLFSLVCSVLAVMLVYRVVSFFIRDVITEESSYELAPRVSTVAGVVAAVAFMCAVPVWHAATRFQYQNFVLLFPLLAAQMMVWFSMYRRCVFLVLFTVLCGVGLVESSTFIPALVVLAAFALYVLWRAQALSFSRMAWMTGAVALVAGVLFVMVANRFFKAEDCAAMGLESIGKVMLRMLQTYKLQVGSGLTRPGTLLLLLFGVVPLLMTVLAAFRGLNNERSISQYALHVALSLLVIFSLVNLEVVSPWKLLKPVGKLPVGVYAMTAMAAGYLFAYWYLLLKVRSGNRAHHVPHLVRRTGEWMGVLIAYPFVVVIVVASLLNSFDCSSTRGMFADRCAKEILDRMGSRTWIVTDGSLSLDPHLQIMAKERGMDLGLFSLHKSDSKYYLASLWKQIEEKQMFAEADSQKLKIVLEELGVLWFLQDWFKADPEIGEKVVILGFPDLWVTAGLAPVPDFLFFSGCHDIQTLKGRPLLNEHMAFWQSMVEKDLAIKPQKRDVMDPTNFARKNLRRHMGFVANNLGVLLEELENSEDALTVYNYVVKTIDADNIASLFNRFEMTVRGVDITQTYKEQIEKELKAVVDKLLKDQRKYPLWSISRYYGYIRSPEIYAQMGWSWALSGQSAVARMNIGKIIDLLPDEKRIAALQAMAELIYRLPDGKKESEQLIDEIIEVSPENLPAIMGKIRLSLQKGAVTTAQEWLEKAKSLETRQGAFGVEWATLHLMNTNSAQARVVLQQTTDLQPRNLQAWAMLALLQLQQDETDDVENVILPRMENIMGDGDSYFTRIIRAQLALKKAEPLRRKIFEAQEQGLSVPQAAQTNLERLLRQAREAFIRAAEIDPTIQGAKDWILQLDIEMADELSAEKHARQVLRSNRDHALANYILGSLRLKERAYGEAEYLLKLSVAKEEIPAALNDLAEVLRRIKKLGEAETFARKAVEKNPKLYVAWETLGSILLEENKDLREAEQAVNRALSLYDKDARVKITLARIQLRKGDIEHARDTIRQVESQRGTLTPFDLEELAKLKTEMATARK
ncbi:MAG: hypothetical protein FWH21_03540 [Kiritimatiellaeota bacterium]|nr:hypothetical protein [Kiritimatiellota bacterium]